MLDDMPKESPRSELNNQDIFAYALYRLDGAGRFVDVEDIVEECFRLSPSRFGWRTKAFPSDRKGTHALSDLESAHPEFLIKTPNGLGRQLTGDGVQSIRSRLRDFEALGAQETRAPKTRRPSYRMVVELENHSWARAFLQGSRSEVTKIQAADMLSCAPDSPKQVWRQRLTSLRAAAVDNEREDVLELLDFVLNSNPTWFEEV